jgi:hypothetical protein
VRKNSLKASSQARDNFIHRMESKYQVHEESKLAFQNKHKESKTFDGSDDEGS